MHPSLRPLPSSFSNLISPIEVLLLFFPLPSQIFSSPSRCCLLKFYNRPRSERASEQASEVRLGLNVHQFRKSPLFCSPACLPACLPALSLDQSAAGFLVDKSPIV